MSDPWSGGVIIFRALTGRAPVEGQSAGDLVYRICADPLRHARAQVPDLPPGVDAFFVRALARSPDDRPQSAPELARVFAEMAGARSVASTTSAPIVARRRRARLRLAVGLRRRTAVPARKAGRPRPQAQRRLAGTILLHFSEPGGASYPLAVGASVAPPREARLCRPICMPTSLRRPLRS